MASASDRLIALIVATKLAGHEYWSDGPIMPCSHCRELAESGGWTLRWCEAGRTHHLSNDKGSYYYIEGLEEWPTS